MKLAFIRHLHPLRIDPDRARFSYTFCLGGASLFFFSILILTGGLLLFYYVPALDLVGASMMDITYAAPFGRFIRNMHYWAGQAMVLCLLLHMARVVVTGSYAPPRRLNWLVGLALLALTVLDDFTGYILRWDAVGQMAATVALNIVDHIPLVGGVLKKFIAGGAPLSQTALLRYYIFHSFLLPGALLVGIMYHFWRVREDGRMRPL